MRSIIMLVLSCLFSIPLIAQNWVELDIPFSTRYDDVFFIDNDIGWSADGNGHAVQKTIDGGESWTELFTTNGEYLRNISFLDEERGFLGTLTPHFYKTIDGGQTWDTINIPGVEAICGLDVIGNNTVYGCGAYFEPAYVIKSTDGGDNWEFIDMSAYANSLVEVLFLDEDTGFVSGGNSAGGTILKTTDGGQTWTEIFNTGTPGELIWKMQQLFSNPDQFFGSVQAVSPEPRKIVKSSDGGQNWTIHDIVPTNTQVPDDAIQGVGFISETHGWASGRNSGLLETLDGGITWAWKNNTFVSGVNRFFVINENLVYAAGDYVYKFTDVVSVKKFASSPQPKGLDIIVSPNPLDDQLNITIQFENMDHMVITLYDEVGKKIKRMSRETILEKGMKKYSFDFPYPAGIYILQFHNDLCSETRQIIKK